MGAFMDIRGVCAAGVAAGLCAGAAQAHHSRAPFDMTSEVVIEGTVAELDWKNPHIALTIETRGSDGAAALQEVEVLSVSEARALGLVREAISPGAHVVVRARPGRRGPGSKVLGLDVTTSDGLVMPLNTDAGISVPVVVAGEAQSIAGRWAPSVQNFYAAIGAMFSWSYTDEARAAMQATLDTPAAFLGICADFPPPALSAFPDLREIEVSDASVVMRFEAQGQHQERIIHLDQTEHPADIAPSLMGHSIGRWEDGVLVVDTVAFLPHAVGVGITTASGPDKHLVERFTLAEDRRHLQYDIVLEDPAALTEPGLMSVQWDYRPDLEPTGVECDVDAARRALEE